MLWGEIKQIKRKRSFGELGEGISVEMVNDWPGKMCEEQSGKRNSNPCTYPKSEACAVILCVQNSHAHNNWDCKQEEEC